MASNANHPNRPDALEDSPSQIRKVLVIFNPRSGTLLAASDENPETKLRTLFTERGVEPEVHAFDCDALPRLIQKAETEKMHAIVVCGGDGSILSVVKALGNCQLPLGVIRGGTMNILARDLGLPEALDAAVDVIVGGKTRAIDMGIVNEEPFLCNSAIGMMPHLARTREKLREVSWWWKWPTVLRQAINLLRTYPRLHILIEINGETRLYRTRAIAISNNPLADAKGPIPPRETLDSGKLGIYIARDTSRWAIIRVAAQMLAGNWQHDDTVASITIQSAVLSLDRPRPLSVMNDGEATQMKTPLHYSIRPQALRVFVP